MNEQINHTIGPWGCFDSRDAHIPPADKGHDFGWIVRGPEDSRTVIAVGVEQADAARIVACVNACVGMDDPEKEIKELRDDLENTLEP